MWLKLGAVKVVLKLGHARAVVEINAIHDDDGDESIHNEGFI